ncbi:Uncharacterised protein [Achromobacter xylosoxidans]|uniref:hypothetical protein n=1 Tax=Alcaligenes xylosoxydans xylosoxydans TaxID=85698 RepID=UPI0006C50926|nr:hypothetical protein [Achromobacter xylosoxidans]CUK13189.1 Uncharacterised protein [Achromobacter xylosoxidans]
MNTTSSVDKRLLIVTFIRTRMVARKYLRQLDSLRHDRRKVDRMAARAEVLVDDGEMPASTAVAIQGQRDTIQRIFDDLKAGQADLARFLPDILSMMDTALTLNERYDLLNVNAVHRKWTDADAPPCLEMIMVHGLEDSADRHARDWLDGPLFECLHASMWNFFRTDPKGRATLDFMTDAAFGPGGPFEHVTLQRFHSDGTVEDIPPSERAKAPSGAILH